MGVRPKKIPGEDEPAKIPAPTAYVPSLVTKPAAPAFSMTKTGHSMSLTSIGPGPGAYTPEKPAMKPSPKYTIPGRWKEKKPDETPAPVDYAPVSPDVHKNKAREKKKNHRSLFPRLLHIETAEISCSLF
jgi:hypothetical protein